MTGPALPALGDNGEEFEARLCVALGRALRTARRTASLTYNDVITRLPSPIADVTLNAYERGIRRVTAARLVQISTAIGVSAADILAEAMVSVGAALTVISITVDLAAITSDLDTGTSTAILKAWALNQRALHGGTTARLTPDAVAVLAVLCELPHDHLARRLLDRYTPLPPSPDTNTDTDTASGAAT